MMLNNQVALVTGPSRGLGLAIAKVLRREGARIVINYLKSKQAAHQVAQELSGIAVKADVTSLEEVQNLFEKAEEYYEAPISIVIDNALADFRFNGNDRRKIVELEWSDFDAQLRTTLQGALNTTKTAIAGFQGLGGGRIS